MKFVFIAAVVAAVTVQSLAQRSMVDPDGRGRPTASKRERIEASIASMRSRAVLPVEGEIAETGEWVAPATEAVTFAQDQGGVDFGVMLDVALIFADAVGDATVVQDLLLPDPRVQTVTMINATTVTPTASELAPFDAVLVWSNASFLDSVALGDELADYVDAGGGCVLSMLAMRGSAADLTVRGRFLQDNYYCIQRSVGVPTTGLAELGAVLEPASELIDGVASFIGSIRSWRSPSAPHPSAVRIADWDTGEVLIAQREDLPGGRVDLGYFPVPGIVGGWDSTTDGDIMLVNALVVASRQQTGRVYYQGPASSTGTIRNSNLPGLTGSDQQYADDFTTTGGAITEVVLWGVYSNGAPPATQDFVVRIFDDAGGLPGAQLYASGGTTLSYSEVGFNSTAGLPIFEYRVLLATPFLAAPGVKYWLSPLGNTAGPTWAWNATTAATGASAYRFGNAGVWAAGTPAREFAFALYADRFRFGGNTQTFTGLNLLRGNVISVNTPQLLDAFSMELELAANLRLWTYVMQADSSAGPFSPIYSDSRNYTGGLGPTFYGSGRMNAVLVPGKFYFVGFGWNGTVDYFRGAGMFPQAWPLGTRHGIGTLNNAVNPLLGPQVFGAFPSGEYSMRMSFSLARCYANCDESSVAPVLNVQDFTCFLNAFSAAQSLAPPERVRSYANCDNSTVAPVLNVQDFTCFLNKFTAGCPQ